MGFRSLDEVSRLTLNEYSLLFEAEDLKQIDTDYRVHQQAWLSAVAKAEKRTKNKVKIVFDRFEKFYDYDKALNGTKQIEKGSKMDRCLEFMKGGRKDGN